MSFAQARRQYASERMSKVSKDEPILIDRQTDHLRDAKHLFRGRVDDRKREHCRSRLARVEIDRQRDALASLNVRWSTGISLDSDGLCKPIRVDLAERLEEIVATDVKDLCDLLEIGVEIEPWG
jgi:hypothetical protein